MLSSKEIAAIDKKVDKLLTSKLAAGGNGLKAIWATVRPIVLTARGLLFWKPKWQQAIDKLVAALDAFVAA